MFQIEQYTAWLTEGTEKMHCKPRKGGLSNHVKWWDFIVKTMGVYWTVLSKEVIWWDKAPTKRNLGTHGKTEEKPRQHRPTPSDGAQRGSQNFWGWNNWMWVTWGRGGLSWIPVFLIWISCHRIVLFKNRLLKEQKIKESKQWWKI